MKNRKSNEAKQKKEDDFPGYPPYPSNEDIYNNEEEADLNPDDLKSKKNEYKFPDTQEALEIDSIETGDDLDVPGTELDDNQESIGNEDEENNYYSLGGDDMENLEEDNVDNRQ